MKPTPKIGTLVHDPQANVTGILTDVMPFADPAAAPGSPQAKPKLTAFVRAPTTGTETRCAPEALVTVGDGCMHPRLVQRPDGKYCALCDELIYARRRPS